MEEDLKRGHQLIYRLEFIQYQYFNGRPQWTSIEFKHFKLFMAHIYFKSPFNNNEEISKNIDDTRIFEYYKDEEKQCILDMYKIIVENVIQRDYSNIEVGVTISHSICKMKCDVCQNFPQKDVHQWYLIRVKVNHIDVSYIDLVHGRIYKSWEDYIDNNSLPKGYMFYPESGYYEEKNYLFQNLTPSSRRTEKILSCLDLVGTVANFVSGILLTGGSIFTVMSPIFIPASLVITSFSAYDAGRQLAKLRDISQHNQSLVGKKSVEHWINLTISALGAITAPVNVVLRSLKITNSVVLASDLGKSLLIAKKGICITQFSLEIVRFTVNIINDSVQVSITDLMALRLDLFIIIGTLLSINYIQNILECLKTSFPFCPMFTTIMDIPYCLGQHICTAVRFVKKHFTVFIEHVTKFLNSELTSEKLFFALENFCNYSNLYVRKLKTLKNDDLLKHIVYDIITLSCEELETVKSILCGGHMKELLNKLNAKNDRCLAKFCIERVVDKAKTVSSIYSDSVKELSTHHLNAINKIDKEFCKQFELEKCCMSQYVLYSIKEITNNIRSFLKAYGEYESNPKNQFEEELVASETNGNQSIKTYTIVAPCGDLDFDTCMKFSNLFDSRNNEYSNYEYTEPKPNVSVLYSVSLFSVKIVFFSITTDGEVPSMNISFFRDSQGSIGKRLQF